MTRRKGEWTFTFELDDHDRIAVSLRGGRVAGLAEYDIDTLVIEGAYELIRQSETFAALLAERKSKPFSLDRWLKDRLSRFVVRRWL